MRRCALVFSIVLLGLFQFIGLSQTASAKAADGTYQLNYQVNQPNSNSASIANDYFTKPANVVVSNGIATVKLTLKNSKWIKEFNPPGGAKVIQSNEAQDVRTVQFTVNDISKPVNVGMKVEIPDINYKHSYTVSIAFAAVPQAKVEQVTPAPTPKPEAKPTPQPAKQPVVKPDSKKQEQAKAPATEEKKKDSPKETPSVSEKPEVKSEVKQEPQKEEQKEEPKEQPAETEQEPKEEEKKDSKEGLAVSSTDTETKEVETKNKPFMIGIAIVVVTLLLLSIGFIRKKQKNN